MRPCRQYLLTRSTQPENRYGPFVQEILRSEGLMGFEAVDLDAAPMPAFGPGDLILLTRCFLRNAEIDQLLQAISNGAGAVLIQPPQGLLRRLGWKTLCRVTQPGYVKIRQGYPGAGLPIQTHLPIALNSPAEANARYEVVADARDRDWKECGAPASVKMAAGSGRVAILFYDLPQAVARIRFGDPDLAGYTTTGLWDRCHAGDLYQGFLDLRLAHLPQADYHGQLLAKLLTDVCPWPLARLWYYESPQHRTAAVVQSDDDWSTPEQFDRLTAALEKRGATATFYLVKDTKLSDAKVAAFRARGHTFGPHANPHNCPDEWYFAFRDVLKEETDLFDRRWGPRSGTLQCHCAPWLGYLDWVPFHAQYGYRLLFAHLSLPVHLWGRYMCGSGRPMKFFDGALLDCWHQPVVTYDDASVKKMMEENLESVRADFDGLLNRAVTENHTAVPILSHPVSFCTYSSPFMEPTFDHLQQAGAPIYNGDQWLRFIDRRAAVSVQQSVAADGRVVCQVAGLKGKITLMIPAGAAANRVRVNDVDVEGILDRRLGADYLFIPLDARNPEQTLTVMV